MMSAQAAAILFSILLLGSISSYLIFDNLKQAQIEKLEVLSVQISRELQYSVKTLSSIMERVETLDYHKNYRDLPLLQHFSKFQNTLPVLSWINENGTEETKVVSGQVTQNFLNWGDNPWFQKAMAHPGQVYFHGPVSSTDIEGLAVEF